MCPVLLVALPILTNILPLKSPKETIKFNTCPCNYPEYRPLSSPRAIMSTIQDMPPEILEYIILELDLFISLHSLKHV